MINMTGFNAALTGAFLGATAGCPTCECNSCTCSSCNSCGECSACGDCPGNSESISSSINNQLVANLEDDNHDDGVISARAVAK